MFQTTIYRKIQDTSFMINNIFPKNRGFYEIMENIFEPDSSQMKIRHMHIACWLKKARKQTHPHNIYCFFPRKLWLREHT
jgi:hypothetical protein